MNNKDRAVVKRVIVELEFEYSPIYRFKEKHYLRQKREAVRELRNLLGD